MAASAVGSVGRPMVRRKSPPVPLGSRPSTASLLSGVPSGVKKPLTTSLSVPSPPQETTRVYPSASARRVAAVASRGAVVWWTS